MRNDGMAGGAIYYDADGVEREITAEVVILACNGVGTPRLLLNSKSNLFPEGLANSSGLVGRNLMFHPYSAIRGTFETDLDGAKGPGNCIWSQEFYETDTSRGFVRGFTYEIARGGGPVNTAVNRMLSGEGRLGRGAPPILSKRRQSHHGDGGHLRGSPRRTQHRDARLRTHGFERHSGPEDRLYVEREQPQDAGLFRRAGDRGAGGGGAPSMWKQRHRFPLGAGT